MLWNLTILMQIKFGDKMVTHLSEWPYIVSLTLLLVMIVEFLALEYVANILYHDLSVWKIVAVLFSP